MKMDTLIRQILDASQLDEWFKQNGVGWLMGERMLATISVVIGAIILYYIGRVLINWGIRHAIRSAAKNRAWHRKDIEKREATLLQLGQSSWQIIIIGYAVAMVANKLFLFDLAPLFASAGIIGVAIGFGSQSLIKDFISGVFIIAENQYRVGDIVDIMGSSGKVERVGTRSTVLRDDDGNVHYIPNGTIQKVINKTMGYSLARFSLQLDPHTDVVSAADIVNQVGKELAKEKDWKKKIIDPPKITSIGDITGSYVEITISSKTQPSDQWAVASAVRGRLVESFDKAGIKLASLPKPTKK